MAGLIGLGQKIKGEAKAGLLDVARKEASNQIVEDQLKQAKIAQDASTMGMTAGVGAAMGATYGVGTATSAAAGGWAGGAAGGAIGLVIGFLLSKLFG